MRRYLVLAPLVAAVALASAFGCSSSSGGGGTGGDASTAGNGSSGGSGPGCALILAFEDGAPPSSCVWSQDSNCTSTRVSGHCPSADLFGCCVLSPMGFTQATCAYGDGGSVADMIAIGNCEDAGNTWQTTAP
ncbi:MAG: hypothetical protein ACLP1X_11585 [Polyangiaceae bacterium]|jgi:hypothetical protein